MAGKYTVLVVDDSEDEIRLMERVLSRVSPDITVESTLSGEEGLALLRNSGVLPLVALLDLKMTGINGIETLRQIRADDRLKDLPVVIVTNSNLDSDREDALDAGADAFIHKAFDIDRFSSEIKSVLQGLQARAEE